MTDTYPADALLEVKMHEETRLVRCLLERILREMNGTEFVDYQMEKFGKGPKHQPEELVEKK